MTNKEFMNALTSGGKNDIEKLLSLLSKMDIKYCVIGGLAVNAYVEPVVSLDLDIVIVMKSLKAFIQSAKSFFNIKEFSHSVNLNMPKSDLRIQIQRDSRYQKFISRARLKEVMGYKMRIASIEDVLQGKIWAYLDRKRRASKRQKDLADIFRLIESYPNLKKYLPESIKNLTK